jgi:hypothetical protein
MGKVQTLRWIGAQVAPHTRVWFMPAMKSKKRPQLFTHVSDELFSFRFFVHFRKKSFPCIHKQGRSSPRSSIYTYMHTYIQGDRMHLSKSRPRCSPNHFLIKIVIYLLRWEKVATTFCNLLQTSQSKQSHNRRKFAQSDHRTYIHTSPGVQWSSEQPSDQKIVGSSSAMVYVCRV